MIRDSAWKKEPQAVRVLARICEDPYERLFKTPARPASPGFPAARCPGPAPAGSSPTRSSPVVVVAQELSESCVVPNPVKTDRDAPRLYRTGDLGRLTETGEIEYLGAHRRPGQDYAGAKG